MRAAFLALCARASVPIRVPETIGSLCCGTPWKSKGLTEGYATMRERAREALLRATGDGALPVVADAASCTEGLAQLVAGADVTVVDACGHGGRAGRESRGSRS
ncbi:hypothetical protein ACFQ1L_33095 [Phytohabitans flavus]|uniref:hypothetical protein n=1 Tax=Phytohabitans flavus TaxID=1076124 RepID=UPI0036275052